MGALERVKAQLVIVTGLLVLYFVFKSVYLLYASVAIGVISLMIPAVGNAIVSLWFKIAEVLGKINGAIILSVVFWVFLFPIALLYRLNRKNPMSVKKESNPSLYHERNHVYSKEDLEHTW
jgi:hypothetical protein